MLNIKYELVAEKKAKPDWDNLGFGKHFTDHMFIMDYDAGQGWHDARIVPYQNLSLDPACMVFHYAQEMFEGLKAYRTPDGEIQLFRPDQNIDRMNNTNERLCIPQLDKQDVLDALKAIVKTEEDWVPAKEYLLSPKTWISSRPGTRPIGKYRHSLNPMRRIGHSSTTSPA